MLYYDPRKPSHYEEKLQYQEQSSPFLITDGVLQTQLNTPENAYRRRLELTRVVNPNSKALERAELELAKERSLLRTVHGSNRHNIGARLLSKMGFSGEGGLGKRGEGISTPLVHKLWEGCGHQDNARGLGAKSGHMANQEGVPTKKTLRGHTLISTAPESQQVQNLYRTLKKSPSRILSIAGVLHRSDGQDVHEVVLRTEIEKEFLKYGKLESISFISNQNAELDTPGDEIFLFIEYLNMSSAIKAAEALEGKLILGKKPHLTFYDENLYNRREFNILK